MSEPVEIGRFIDIRQAELVRSVLEGSGIEAFIDQPYTGTIAPYLTMTSGVRLFVSSDDKDRALDVLRSIEEVAPADQRDSEPEGRE